jgi:hypothetical protein
MIALLIIACAVVNRPDVPPTRPHPSSEYELMRLLSEVDALEFTREWPSQVTHPVRCSASARIETISGYWTSRGFEELPYTIVADAKHNLFWVGPFELDNGSTEWRGPVELSGDRAPFPAEELEECREPKVETRS